MNEVKHLQEMLASKIDVLSKSLALSTAFSKDVNVLTDVANDFHEQLAELKAKCELLDRNNMDGIELIDDLKNQIGSLRCELDTANTTTEELEELLESERSARTAKAELAQPMTHGFITNSEADNWNSIIRCFATEKAAEKAAVAEYQKDDNSNSCVCPLRYEP